MGVGATTCPSSHKYTNCLASHSSKSSSTRERSHPQVAEKSQPKRTSESDGPYSHRITSFLRAQPAAAVTTSTYNKHRSRAVLAPSIIYQTASVCATLIPSRHPCLAFKTTPTTTMQMFMQLTRITPAITHQPSGLSWKINSSSKQTLATHLHKITMVQWLRRRQTKEI